MRKIQKTLLLLVIIVTIFASNSIVAFADVAASRCVPFKNGLAEYNGGVYTYKFSYEDLEGEKLENAYEFMQSYQDTLDNPDKKYFYTNQYTSDTDIRIVLVDEMKSSSHLFSTSSPHYGYYLHYKGYSYRISPSAAISDGTTCVLNVTGSYSQTSWDTAMGAHTATMWTSRPGNYSKTGWNYYFPRGGYGYTHNILTGVSQILFEETSGIDPTEHTITVRYNYTNGKQAAETVTQTIHCGDSYRIESPTIPGYTASRKVVAGTLTSSVGNAKDIDVEVIYYPQTSGGTGEGIVNVTIPSSVTLYIGGDNNNQTFTDEVSLNIQNDGSPITLDTVTFTPGNWSLIPDKSELGLNEKKLVIDFNLDGQVTSVTNEKNTVETGVRIESGQSLPYGFTYHYGTWTDDHTPEEAFTITMNYSVEGVNASEGTLVTGPEIREIIASYPEVKNIVITDDVAPVEADTKDITSEKNFFIVYWVDGETLTVSTQRPDTKVKANEDCSEMFQGIEGLESIDLSNLDTSATKNMNDMFSGLTLKKLDLSALNTKAVETSNNMLCKLSKLEEITFGTDFNIQSSTNLTKPSSIEIENASNKWYNTKNEGFEPEEIPAGVADTYSVFAKTAAIDIDKLNNNLTGIEGLEIGTKTKKDITKIFGEEEFTPIDISKDGSGLVNLVVKDNVAYVYGESSGNIDATNPFSHIIDPTNTTLKSVSIGEYLKGLEDISSMFEGCTNLEKVDLNKMNTSKVTIMDNAFSGCTNLTNVVVDHLDTSAVTSMTGTFEGCSNLETLDVSGWDTKAVTESTDIFTNSNKLKEVYVGVNTTIHNKLPAQTSDNIPGADGKWYNSAGTAFNPGNLTLNTAQKWSAVKVVLGSMGTLGANINGMTHLYIGTVTEPPEGSTTPIDVGTTKNGSVMLAKVGTSAYVYSPNGNFQVNPTGGVIGTGNCTYVEVGKYVKNTTLTRYWFQRNTKVNHVKLTDLDTTQVINMNSMFNSCTNLKKIELPVSKNKNIDLQMFLYNTAALEEIDLSIFDTSYVQNAANCFGYSKLSEIDLSTLDLGELEIAQYMFRDSKATSINLSGLKTNKLWDVRYMFQSMPNLQNIILDGWDVSNVTDASNMFSGNSATSVDLSKLHFNSLTNATGMFYNMVNLTEVTLPKDTGKVVKFTQFFDYDRSLATINGLDYLDTSSAEDLSYMFRGCTSLPDLSILNKWDMSKVTTLVSMFQNASGTETLDLSGWEVPELKTTNSMFSGSKFKQIDLSNLETPKLNDVRSMFDSCGSLEVLRINKLNTRTITTTNVGRVFNATYKLREVSVGENTSIRRNLLTPTVANIPGTNGKWYSLTDEMGYAANRLPLNVADTYTAIAPYATLDYNKIKNNLGTATRLELGVTDKLPEGGSEPIDVSTEGVGKALMTIKDGTAYVCGTHDGIMEAPNNSWANFINSNVKNLKELKIGGYVKGIIYAYNLVNGNSSLEEIDISEADLSKVTNNGTYIFYNCSSVRKINFSNPTTTNFTSLASVFSSCPKLEEVDITNLDTSNVTTISGLFYSCTSLESIDLGVIDTSKVVNWEQVFQNCSSLRYVNTNTMDTSAATAMNRMFDGCSSLESIDVNKLDTSNVTNTNSMFSGCTGLKDIQIDSIDVSKVTNMQSMFYNCASLEKLNLSGWANTAVTSANCGSIFNLDYKLKEIEIGENTRYIQNKLLALNGTQLPGANGKWYSKTTGREYAVNQIPTGVHDTYIAIAPFGNLDLARLKANLGDATKLEVGTLETLPEGGSEPVDVSTEQGGLIKLSIKDGTAYVVGLGEEPGVIKVQSLSQMLTSSQNNIKSVILGEYIKGLTAFNNLLLNCTQVEEVDISKLDLSNVTSANSIFKGCTSLKKVNISNPTTTKITDFSNALSGTGIESLSDVNMEKLDMPACTNMQYFLSDCMQLETVRFPVLNTSKVTNLQYLLKGCTNLREANLNGLDTSAVTYVNYWMDGCINLVNVDISRLDFTKLSGDGYAFRNCTKLNSISVGSKTKLLTRTLPTPSATYIPGADGYWHTATGEAFTPAQIPYNKAETYYAVVPDAGSMDGDKLRDNLGDANELYLGVYKSGEIDGITTDNTLDISAAQDRSVKLTVVDGKAYVYGALTPKVIAPADLSHILGNGDSISLVKVGQYFIDAVNTDEMFDGYTNLTTVDVADFDTSKVTSMNSMFRNLENISRLDLGKFDTKNVSSNTEIFDGCVRLGEVIVGKDTTIHRQLPIPNADYLPDSTGYWYDEAGNGYLPSDLPLNRAASYYIKVEVGTMSSSKLEAALKNLYNAKNPVDNVYVGTLTSGLDGGTEPIDISEEGDGSVLFSAKDGTAYIYGAKSNGALKLDLDNQRHIFSSTYYSNKKILKVGSRVVGLTTCNEMFRNCHSATIDISEMNTSAVTSMEYMFQNSANSSIILATEEHSIDISNVKSMQGMFMMSYKLASFTWPEELDTSKVENFSSMFDSCSALSSLDIKNINVDGAINLGRMIASCNSLTTIDVSHFNTSNATNLIGMFSYNPKLTSVKSNLDFKSANSAKGMFANCSSLKTLDLTGWKNTQNIKNIDQMFYYCTAIQNFNTSTINTTGWDTSNIVSTHGTFGYCSNMVTCDISNWNLPNLKHIGEMFLYDEKLTILNVSGVSLAHLGEADEVIDTYWESLGGNVFWKCDSLNKITLGENINNGQKRFGPGQATKVWQNQDTGRLILPSRTCEDDLLEPGTWVKLPESTKIVSFYNGDDDDPINSLVKREIVTTSTVPSSMYPPAQSSTGYWGSMITVESNAIEVYGDFRAFWIEPAAASSIKMTDTLGDKEELCPYEYRGYLKSVKSIIFYNSDFEVVKSHQRLEDNTEPQYPEALTPTGHWGEPIEDEFGDIHIIWEESSNQIIFIGPDGNIVAQYPAILDSGIESIYPDPITETGHWGEPIEDENGNFIITWEEPEVTKIHLRFYDQNKKLLKEVEIDAETDITEYYPELISEVGEWGEPIETEAGDIEVYWVEIKEIPDEETPLAPPTVVTPEEEVPGDASDGDASDGDASDGDASDGDTSNSDESGVRDDSKDELPDENTSGGDITNDEILDEDEGEVTDTEDTFNEDTSDTLDGSQDEDEVVDNTDTQETDESSIDTIEDETQGDDRDTEEMSTEDTQENEAAES